MRLFTLLSLAASGLVATLIAGAVPGHAGTIGHAPWCAVQDLGAGDIVWDCEFQSVEQCQPAVVAGNRGFCNLNPASPQYQPAPPAPRHHKRQYHAS